MSGRVVIVTGASSGIGAAAARAFGRAGDRVVLTARRAERLEALAAQIPDAVAIPADLADPGAVAATVAGVVDAAVARFGTVDVLVNNAGTARCYDWLDRVPEDDIRAEIAVNLMAPVLLARAVLPIMQARGRGVIVNVASVAGKIGTPTTSIYNATKFGLDGFSQALRREALPQGIEVCILYPGPTSGTELGRHLRPGATRLKVGRPRWMTMSSEAVADAIVRLADRPRSRQVIPPLFGPLIALNALWPALIDRIVVRAARRARLAREP
jgi:short-subunit dehydrogenase